MPPFYCYRNEDAKRITEALEDGCGVDAPGSFAAWLSRHTEEYAWIMPGKDMTSEIVRAMMKYARGLVSLKDISGIYFFSNVI